MQQFAMPVEAAALNLGVSTRKVWSLVKSGELDSRRIGRHVVVTADAIREYLAKQPTAANAAAAGR
jgi:excisionase family DNA binding protein